MKHIHWLYVVIGVLAIYLGYSWYQSNNAAATS